MRLSRVETIELPPVESAGPYLFVRLHTADGAVGLGETYFRPSVDAEVIHEHLAPLLFETDPLGIERVWRDAFQPANKIGGQGGAEMRALSAVDIALWDLRGKAAGAPIHELLGGPYRESLPTYNTCYESGVVPEYDYDFMTEPVAFAESLLDDGIEAMKIWPYDGIAEDTGGRYISPGQLEAGAEPLRAIREAVGPAMDVALEFHGHWDATSATRIARHVEQYEPMWLEDLLEVGDLEANAGIADATGIPLAISERLMGKYDYRQLLSTDTAGVVLFDVEWVGGITEAKKIAAMAEAHQLPVAPHNCGGPVLHFATMQLCAALPNVMVVESVRERYDGWHRDLITTPATVEDGEVLVPDGPGLGTELDETVLDRADVVRRESTR